MLAESRPGQLKSPQMIRWPGSSSSLSGKSANSVQYSTIWAQSLGCGSSNHFWHWIESNCFLFSPLLDQSNLTTCSSIASKNLWQSVMMRECFKYNDRTAWISCIVLLLYCLIYALLSYVSVKWKRFVLPDISFFWIHLVSWQWIIFWVI